MLKNKHAFIEDRCLHHYQHSWLKDWKRDAEKRLGVGRCHPFAMIQRSVLCCQGFMVKKKAQKYTKYMD